MILADTSVWIDHLRKGDAELKALLAKNLILTHPFVIGELALGSIPRRADFLVLLGQLPKAKVAADDEVLRYIEQDALHGQGVGYIDAHLLAATRLTPGARLWTRDKRLAALAAKLGMGC